MAGFKKSYTKAGGFDIKIHSATGAKAAKGAMRAGATPRQAHYAGLVGSGRGGSGGN